MNYIPLSEHKKAWIFRRADLPISEADAQCINPMTSTRANTLWQEMISRQSDHPDFFRKGDWAFSMDTWQETGDWETTWDSDAAELPEPILEHLQWEANTIVYYCNDQNSVIETTWAVFQRCWKNFLFLDDGALLIGKRRNEVVQFLSNGTYRLGKK